MDFCSICYFSELRSSFLIEPNAITQWRKGSKIISLNPLSEETSYGMYCHRMVFDTFHQPSDDIAIAYHIVSFRGFKLQRIQTSAVTFFTDSNGKLNVAADYITHALVIAYYENHISYAIYLSSSIYKTFFQTLPSTPYFKRFCCTSLTSIRIYGRQIKKN